MRGKTAVITGAASGLGLAVATRCVEEFGMRVVMADVEADALERAASEIGGGQLCKAVVTDVRKREHFERLLSEAKSVTPGGVIDFLFLNAGVMATGVNVSNQSREDDWRWVMDVNLFGVLHGLQVFLPALLAQSRPSCVAATSSVVGLGVAGPPAATSAYSVSKHAVVALMEGLEGELRHRGALGKVQASVLCPGGMATTIWDVNRQERQRGPEARPTVVSESRAKQLSELFSMAVPTQDAVDTFFAGLAEGKFICESKPGQSLEIFARRSEYILRGERPPKASL